jgi:hypothetical protein
MQQNNQQSFQVGLSGSRFHQPHLCKPVLEQIISATSPAAVWAVGCCPTGLDSFAVASVNKLNRTLSFYQATSQSKEHLRSRTIALVKQSQYLVAFPVSSCVHGSGTWLSVFTAVKYGIPVFVHFPGVKTSVMPTFNSISKWQKSELPFSFCGLSFWSPSVSYYQTQLAI